MFVHMAFKAWIGILMENPPLSTRRKVDALHSSYVVQVNLAFSLHSPFPEERNILVCIHCRYTADAHNIRAMLRLEGASMVL